MRGLVSLPARAQGSLTTPEIDFGRKRDQAAAASR